MEYYFESMSLINILLMTLINLYDYTLLLKNIIFDSTIIEIGLEISQSEITLDIFDKSFFVIFFFLIKF